VAKIVLRLASSDQLHAHLLLGSDAVYLASLVSAERAKEDAKCKELSFSTNFEGLFEFSGKPIVKMLSEKS
jgi:hypothetical protein